MTIKEIHEPLNEALKKLQAADINDDAASVMTLNSLTCSVLERVPLLRPVSGDLAERFNSVGRLGWSHIAAHPYPR